MRTLSVAVIGLMLFGLVSLPEAVLAKKGGVGRGGGYSEDGTFYHSHSDRSYSGKEQFKGQGKALGREKVKTRQKSGKKVKSKSPKVKSVKNRK